jgi:hypothetical protein
MDEATRYGSHEEAEYLGLLIYHVVVSVPASNLWSICRLSFRKMDTHN